MTSGATDTERAAFRDSIPEQHLSTFDQFQQLIEELVPDADVTIKWGTIAYDLDGSLFALSANKKHVNLYILTVGLLAGYAEELAGIPQGKCVLRFGPHGRDANAHAARGHGRRRGAQAGLTPICAATTTRAARLQCR